MPTAYLAPSLVRLREQVNAAFPRRSRKSDGWIGDAKHSARASDHNPDGSGIVRALDITHDPVNGCDSHKLALALVASRDARIKYIISRGKICSGTNQSSLAWRWRKYSGANPHNHHVHVSVKASKVADESKKDWDLDVDAVVVPKEDQKEIPETPDTIKIGSQGETVEVWQRILWTQTPNMVVDGDFGPRTEAATKEFQRLNKLTQDGIVGPATWAAALGHNERK